METALGHIFLSDKWDDCVFVYNLKGNLVEPRLLSPFKYSLERCIFHQLIKTEISRWICTPCLHFESCIRCKRPAQRTTWSSRIDRKPMPGLLNLMRGFLHSIRHLERLLYSVYLCIPNTEGIEHTLNICIWGFCCCGRTLHLRRLLSAADEHHHHCGNKQKQSAYIRW